MPKEKQVYLLSGTSGSGKTTSLINFVESERNNGKSFGGILQIIRNNKRHLRFLSDDSVKLLQLNNIDAHPKTCDGSSPQNAQMKGHNNIKHMYQTPNGDIINCGPFQFSKKVLNESHTELMNAYQYDYCIIDEIGPLELKRKNGYEPAITEMMNLRHNEFKNTKFIIVVRPSLKSQIALQYNIPNIDIAEFHDLFKEERNIPIAKAVVFTTVVSLCSYFVYKRFCNKTN